MAHLGMRKKDVEERFIRSRGPGGQNVNKTATCVWLRHMPTGIEVRCQKERSQALNRAIAWGALAEKINQRLRAQRMQELAKQAEARRARWKRPRRLKLQLVQAKRRHSEKKRLRAKRYEVE